MSRNRENGNSADLGRARDELFSHIHRCGVLKATEEQQIEWMDDTIAYVGERYPELSEEQLDVLRVMGMRFCRPAVPYGSEFTANNMQGVEDAASEAAV
ncbi:hypothetical protein BH24GEM3_BH24GEM3_09620 [soil metagenome]